MTEGWPSYNATNAPLAVVGASGNTSDAFETKAVVFIAETAKAETLSQALKECLAMRASPAGWRMPRAAQTYEEERSEVNMEDVQARFQNALRIYNADRWEEWSADQEWQSLRSALMEVVLNHALRMGEMLTEERSDLLRKLVSFRSAERIRERLDNIESRPFQDPCEEWESQLFDWQEMLWPYPWDRVRSQVMSRVLGFAQLQEPLTQHARLVRSYEFLRCLGGDISLVSQLQDPPLDKLEMHGTEFGCWRQGDVTSEVMSSYLTDVVGVDPSSTEVKQNNHVLRELGFSPKAVRSKRLPVVCVACLADRLIKKVSVQLRTFCDSRGLSGTWRASEHIVELSREVSQRSGTIGEHANEVELLQDFLLAAAEDYIQRTLDTSAGSVKTIDFPKLARADERFETIQSFAEQARLLDDMSMHELIELTNLIKEAFDMVHDGNLPPDIHDWIVRLANGASVLHPSDIGNLSATLQDFLQQNNRLCKVGEEDALHNCVARALSSTRISGRSVAPTTTDTTSSLGRYIKPDNRSVRRIVACFGVSEAIVIRAVPLGLSDAGDDYEVREVGLRIGGMYRMSGDDKTHTDCAGSGVLTVHYDWVPEGEVREDSKPLEQILSDVTHVRLLLPEGSSTEQREVDLQTYRVYGDSAWYRNIPSRPRNSADQHGGFRRFVLEVGRGLRLPLPNGLLQAGPGMGVVETADVLAHVLALWFSQKHSRQDITKEVRERPALLYFASVALFECFDHLAANFREAIESHWASVLGLRRDLAMDEVLPLSYAQCEAQEILLELLIARPDERLCATLPSAHLHEFCSLVEKTRHSIEFLAVERFCFESALEKIRGFEDSFVTFIIIDVTGPLSALQLGELVQHASGAIRLILNWYHGLVPSLSMTRSIHRVIVPASLESDSKTQLSPTTYHESFALGQATFHAANMMSARPEKLTPLAGAELCSDGPVLSDIANANAELAGPASLDWLRNLREAQQRMLLSHSWMQREAEWRKKTRPDQALKPNEALMLLVSVDEAFVRRHFDSLPAIDGVQCFSVQNGDRQNLAHVDALLERMGGPHKGTNAHRHANVQSTIVLFGVSFVSVSKLQDIVARSYLTGQRVVLVVQEPTAALRSIRVTSRHATQYVHATMVWACDVPEGAAPGLRALRLVLGPEALPWERQASFQGALETDDATTCADLLQSILKPEISRDLIAGIATSLYPSSKLQPSDSRTLAFAIGCLAATFVRKSMEIGLDQKIWDLSFSDFRAYVPACRFLDQISVLEAWCRYLDLTNAVVESATSIRLPEGLVVWPHNEPKRHFILSHWTPCNNVHALGLEDFLELALVRENNLEPFSFVPPAYVGTGPVHQSEALEEVLERRCLQRRDLDWSQFSESWRTALDIKPELFLQLATFGVDTLRLFLCLPPERAIELGLTHLLDIASKGGTPQSEIAASVAKKLLRDIVCIGPLLDAIVELGASELAVRFAAVKWLLLTALPEEDAVSMLSGVCRIDESTVARLVQAKVMLAPRGRVELLRRVVAIVIGLDGGDVLASQHEIRTFLLETKMPLQSLLSHSQATIGRAIVSFLFSPDHTEQLKKHETGLAVVDSFERMFGYDVLHWKAVDLDSETLARAQPHRFSPAAHAAVLERAPDLDIGREIACGPLLSAMSHLVASDGAEKADAFLCEVFDHLPSGSDALVIAIIELFARHDGPAVDVVTTLQARPGRGILKSAKNRFLPELFTAFQSQDFGNYLMMASANDGARAHLPLQIALDGEIISTSLYLRSFRKMASKLDEAAAQRAHNAVLDEQSCAVLFDYIKAQGEENEPRDQWNMFLLWCCWSRSPDRQLPLWALPRVAEPTFTLALNTNGIGFVDRCRSIGAGISVLAKFLVSPETLPLGVYNTFARQAPWVHSVSLSAEHSVIGTRTVLLGQEDCEDYSPYYMRYSARALPPPLRNKLLRKCHDDVDKLPDLKSHHFWPRLTSGVNEKIFRHNLGLLQTLIQSNDDLVIYFDHGSNAQRQFLAACIMSWFQAAGFDFKDLLACVVPSEKENFSKLWTDLLESFSKIGPLSLRKNYVRGPLPADIAVRWIEDGVGDVPIFARTRDSALLTAQWLNMLIVHFDLPNLKPFTPEDLVVVSGSRGNEITSGLRFEGALHATSTAIGLALRRDFVADVELKQFIRPLGNDKYDTLKLVSHISVLTDFVSLLRRAQVQEFFNVLVTSLAAEGKQAPLDVHFAALFDALFSLQNITTDNQGIEIEELARAYSLNKLPISDFTLEEIRWLHENYYGRRERLDGPGAEFVIAHLSEFEEVSDRLTRIRELQLRTVAFHRHHEHALFVGELLSDEQHAPAPPPYLQQHHFQLACHQSAAQAMTSNCEDMVGGADSCFPLEEPAFFSASGENCGGLRSGGSMHRNLDRPEGAGVAWQDACPVISALDIVEIDAKESLYLHAPLRVRAGLQPILWHADKSESFYRLSRLSGEHSYNSSAICKVFATNADAWQFTDRAQNAVVMCDGFYLRKSDDGTSWVVVFPAAKSPSDASLATTMGDVTLRQRRYCIWPVCHSYKLVNLKINAESLTVLQLIVWIAYHQSLEVSDDDRVPTFKVELITEPLRRLSFISNFVETAMETQAVPEGDKNLVKNLRQYHKYQQQERFIAEVVLRILTKMKARQRDDLGGLIRTETQRRSSTMTVPFVDSDGQSLTPLGRMLQCLLVPIASKAGILGSPETTKAWTQLELILESCFRGEQLPQERIFAKHMHITKSSFAKKGLKILNGLYQAVIEGHYVPTVQQFSDSEDEDAVPKLHEKAYDPNDDSRQCRMQYLEARSDRAYVDAGFDRDTQSGMSMFVDPDGFGRPLSSRHAVVTFYDEDMPLYYVALNHERLKIEYSASEGMCLGYLVHKNILAELLQDALQQGENGSQIVRTVRNKLLMWIVDVLRSPLANETKTWILRCCERMGMVAVAPYQEANHVNLAVIAYCLCRCCPPGTQAALFLRNVLMNAWHIPSSVRVFIERKSDMYGVYVVKPGTLQKMRELGLQVAVRDFEREVWQRNLNNCAAYLDIISHFSSYCCFTYVQGLPKVDDILLKWLAEYTRFHPWRFIYLEGVDTSFNYPENRDRCNFRFAPPNPLHSIETLDELRSPFIAEIRPSHTLSYAEQSQPMPEAVQDPRSLFDFFAEELREEGSSTKPPPLFASPPDKSYLSSDFRAEFESYLFGKEPCLVLLVSAPGAGKSHHMGALRGRLEQEMQLDIHEFDGSSDILVTTALAEVLQRTMTTQTKANQKLLILDEYHMLSDEHKDELFEWLRSKLGPSLRVVLIANRMDSKDRERLEQARPVGDGPRVRVGLVRTRLSRSRIEQIMKSRGNSAKWSESICDWLVASRFLFGEESVSLRLCDTLEEIMQRPDPRPSLIELILNRVPTISRPTAAEFVAAFLLHAGFRSHGNSSAPGLVGLCFRIAMLDRFDDGLCSFVEFLERTPMVHHALPAVRVLAWCVYMMGAKNKWDVSLSASWVKRKMFVDQVNFPFELAEESPGSLCSSGPAFSWSGDPSSLRDLVDAVKRGHSVDWSDVHKKVWSVEHIKDSELFAQLLSSCHNPGVILQHVMPNNLCSLLRLSSTAAPTAVQLAQIILKHAPLTCDGRVDRPRCLALWTLILHDRQVPSCADILKRIGGTNALVDFLLWARDWATDRRTTTAPALRTKLLQRCLVMVCVQDDAPITDPVLAQLWTGSFGRLLKGPSLSEVQDWKDTAAGQPGGTSIEVLAQCGFPPVLPQQKLHHVFRLVADVQEDWSAEAQAMWRIGHSRSTAREISDLWSAAPHMLQDCQQPSKTGWPVHEYFMHGIVNAPGTLCRSLQRALLCNNCQVHGHISPTVYVSSCADALNEMRNADQLQHVCIGGPAGEAVQLLVREESCMG